MAKRICPRQAAQSVSVMLLANTTGNLAVRKVECFLTAFCAVEYHEGAASFFVWPNKRIGVL